MIAFTTTNPLPMRWPVPPTPPEPSACIDIGVWPGGWRFLGRQDRLTFERMPTADQAEYRRAFDSAGDNL